MSTAHYDRSDLKAAVLLSPMLGFSLVVFLVPSPSVWSICLHDRNTHTQTLCCTILHDLPPPLFKPLRLTEPLRCQIVYKEQAMIQN